MHTHYVSSKEVPKLVLMAAKAGIVLELRGDPGTGKTSMLREFADTSGHGAFPKPLKVIDIRPTQLEAPQLNGLDALDHENRRSTVYTPDWLPVEGDPIPEGYSGWLLIWEERPDAEDDVQKALYKIMMEREAGDKKLHPCAIQVATGNEADSNCFAQEDTDAIKGRKIDLHLRTDKEDFFKLCGRFNINSRIENYLRFRPSNINTYREQMSDTKASKSDKFASERGWFQLNDLVTKGGLDLDNSSEMLPMGAGIVGTKVISDFDDYNQYYASLPDVADIVRYPDRAITPTPAGVKFALMDVLSSHIDATNSQAIMTYINRFPLSYAIVGVINIARKSPDLFLNDSHVQNFVTDNQHIVNQI